MPIVEFNDSRIPIVKSADLTGSLLASVTRRRVSGSLPWERGVRMSDIEILADVLVKRFGHVAKKDDYGWPNSTALCVMDCVLSLNRRYDSVVFPRITAFSARHPEVIELAQLKLLFGEFAEVGQFSAQRLNYNDVRREQTLRGVVDYMLSVQTNRAGATERERLQTWAHSVRPSDYISVGVKGFGLSGFQYMRMLFGVQTSKPDVHVKRFVSETIGRQVNDITALSLLEQAAAKARLPLREVDGAIWEAGARPVNTVASPPNRPTIIRTDARANKQIDRASADKPVIRRNASVQQTSPTIAWWRFWRRKR